MKKTDLEMASTYTTKRRVLRRLSESSDPDVLKALTMNPATPARVFRKLSKVESAVEWVAESKYTPPRLLKRLSQDSRIEVRRRVAENPETPSRTLDRLSYQPALSQRVLRNPNTSQKTREKITIRAHREDIEANTLVWDISMSRERLKALLEMDETLLSDHRFFDVYEKIYLWANVARHPNSDEEILLQISEYEKRFRGSYITTHVRVALAESTETPETLLRELGQDEYTHVLERVAENTSTPVDVIFRLAEVGGTVGDAAKRNPKHDFNKFVENFIEV